MGMAPEAGHSDLRTDLRAGELPVLLVCGVTPQAVIEPAELGT